MGIVHNPPIAQYTYHYAQANFSSTTTTAAYFVPLNGYIIEEASPGTNDGERFGMIAPHDGILSKVMIRSSYTLRHPLLCELVTASTNTELPDTVRGSINVDFAAASVADDTPYTYDFTGALTSGVNTFSKGQVLGIRLDPDGGAQADCYCMCVFRFDITT